MGINKYQTDRYRVIDRMLGKGGKVKTTAIQKAIQNELMKDEKLSSRTIEKDITNMKEAPPVGYNAPIDYDKRLKAWYYTDPDFSIQNFGLKQEEIKALKFYAASLNQYRDYKLFKDFSTAIEKVVNAVKIQSKITGDSRVVIQTDNIDYVRGNEFIVDLVESIEDKKKVKFNYQKYGHQKATNRLAEPLLLKEYRNRWYLIAHDIKKGKRQLRTFALDRMSNLECQDEAFQVDGEFDPHLYYKHSFGIIKQDSSIETVILEFDISQKYYLESLPMHSTQKILSQKNDKIRISVEVIPSYEFYECLLGYGELVKVIKPAHLVNHIKNRIHKALQNYPQ